MRSERGVAFLFTGVVLLALAAYAGFSYGGARAHARESKADPAFAAPEQAARLAELEQSVRELRARSEKQQGESKVSNDRANADGDLGRAQEAALPRQPEPPEDLEALKAEEQAQFQALDDKLETEPIDPGWRTGMERQLTQTIPVGFGPEVKLTGVHCASTICRAELEHPALSKLPMDRIREFMHSAHLPPMEMSFSLAEGKTTFYATRRDATASTAN